MVWYSTYKLELHNGHHAFVACPRLEEGEVGTVL